MMKITGYLWIGLFLIAWSCCLAAPKGIIFVMTDDTGYGDMTYYDSIYPDGATSAATPNLDTLAESAVRLTDFHVGTTCSPSRCALMSGRNFNAAGAWHTILGRELMREDEQTIADAFRANNWATGMFGKWHLGDAYPFGPRFRGFDVVCAHNVGGVSQFGDFWGNDYYSGVNASNNPTQADIYYDEDGKPVASDRHCTDYWFQQAKEFISDNIAANKPFFCYVPLNAAHSPFNEPYGYTDGFDGLIENIDDNMEWLDDHLDSLGVKDDILLVFTTDNGTAGSRSGGLRGKKGSKYDGGHRVPCLWRWKNGGIGGTSATGREVDSMTMTYDVFPTLLDICGLTRPAAAHDLDGISLKDRLLSPQSAVERIEVVDTQRVNNLTYRRNMSVMKDEVDGSGNILHKWRLNGTSELYDVLVDRDQSENIAGSNAAVVTELLNAYDDWWNEIYVGDDYAPFVFDPEKEDESELTGHQFKSSCQWTQGGVNNAGSGSGIWQVRFEKVGTYRVELRRWPREVGGAIAGTKPDGTGTAISNASKVRLQIENTFDQTKDITATDQACVFSVPITASDLDSKAMTVSLLDSSGSQVGVPYLAYVTFEIAPIPDNVVIEPLDSVSDISTDGTLLDAVNFGDTGVTLNSVEFKGYAQDTGADFTTSFLSTRVDNLLSDSSLYTGPVTGLNDILDNAAWDDGDNEGVLTIRGLTPGQHYILQVFLSDNRTGQDGRYAVAQGDLLSDQSVYGGPSSDPLFITYSFTAISGVQTFEINTFNSDKTKLGPQINAFQLREAFNGDLTLDGKVDLEDFSELASLWLLSDGYGLSDLEMVAIHWLDGTVNRSPVFLADPIVLQDASENIPFTDAIGSFVVDPDYDSVEISKFSGPDWLSIDLDGSLSGMPDSADVGLNIFIVQADDNRGGISQAELQITVYENTAPTFPNDPIVEKDAMADIAYVSSIADDVVDADGDTLNFVKISGPEWLSIALDGTLSGTPVSSDIGTNTFTVQVEDGVNALVSASLEINVVDGPSFIFVVSDSFDDGDIATNTLGVGSGFNAGFFSGSSSGGTATQSESDGEAILGGGLNGGQRTQIASKDTFTANGSTASIATFVVTDFGRTASADEHTSRTFVGLVSSPDTGGDGLVGTGVLENQLDGLWVGLQTREDVGGVDNGMGGLFYVNGSTITTLASWTWDQSLVQWDSASTIRSDRIQMDLVDDLTLVLSSDSTGYSLSFATSGSGVLPADISGTWAGAGVVNDLETVLAAAFLQGDTPTSLVLDSVEVRAFSTFVLGELVTEGSPDSWASNIVIDLDSTYTNTTDSSKTLSIGQFAFVAGNETDPITPFIVEYVENANEPTDPSQFTVVAIGDTRTPVDYDLGENYLAFSDTIQQITVDAGETIAFGYLDANADGTGKVSSSVLDKLLDTSGSVWYSGGPAISASGSVSLGYSPVPGPSTYVFDRTYGIQIEFSFNP